MKIKLLLAIVTAALISCSKSDSPAPSIVGTWKFTSGSRTGCTNSANNFNESCTTSCPTITFAANGTYTTSTGISGTYTLVGNRMTVSGSGLPAAITVTSTTLTTVEDKDPTNGCTRTTTYTRS